MSEGQAAEKVSRGEMVALLRSIADAMERGESCQVHVGNQSISVPGHAEVEVEYGRDGDQEELEIELSWSSDRQNTARNLRTKAGIGIAIAAGAVAGGAALLQYLQQHQSSTPEAPEADLGPNQQPDPQEG